MEQYMKVLKSYKRMQPELEQATPKGDTHAIETLEELTAWEFTGDMIRSISDQYLLFNQHLMMMMMKDMALVSEMDEAIGEPNGLYDFLRGHSPALLDRVPPRYLASFMDISEKEFLHLKKTPLRLGMTRKHLRRS